MEHSPIFGIKGRHGPLYGQFGMAPERRRLYRQVREVTHYGEDGRWCRHQIDFEKSIELRPDICITDTVPSLEERLRKTERLQSLGHLTRTILTLEERTVIGARYFNGITLEEVGRWMHFTRQRVLQIEQDALAKLRRAVHLAELLPD